MLSLKDQYIAEARIDQLRREADQHNQQARALAAGKSKAAGRQLHHGGLRQWISRLFNPAALPDTTAGTEMHEQAAV